MSVLAEKEKHAIEWLKMFMSEDDPQGYYLADSGARTVRYAERYCN